MMTSLFPITDTSCFLGFICRFNICSRLKINAVSQRFINHAGVTMDTITFIRWWHYSGRDARKTNATLGSADSGLTEERLLPRVHMQRKSKMLHKPLNNCTQRYNKQRNTILSDFQHHHCNKLISITLVSLIWEAAVWVWPQGWCNKILNVQQEIYGRKHKLTQSIFCWSQELFVFLCNMIAIYQQCAGTCGNVPESEDDTRSSDGRQKNTCISERISLRCAPGYQQEIASSKKNISLIEVQMTGEVMTEILQTKLSDKGKVEERQQPKLWRSLAQSWNTWLDLRRVICIFTCTFALLQCEDRQSWRKISTGTWVWLILIWDTMEMAGRPSEEWRQWSMWHVGRPLNWKCWCQGKSFLLSPLSSGTLCWLFTFREVEQTDIPFVN